MFSHRTNWPLEPNRLTQELAHRREQGLSILDLTESNPSRCGLSPSEEEIHAGLAEVQAAEYAPDPRGPHVAREAVAAYYAERGAHVGPNQIFLTASTSEAYSYVFRLLADPGDEILTPRPSYPLFEFLSGLNDVTAVPYDLRYIHGWQIDRDSLASRLSARTRAVLVVHPNNPTGSYVTREERDFLFKICGEREAGLVADEVFADFAWSGNTARAGTNAGENSALTFTLSGLSKISAMPQMKLAWIVASGPPKLLKRAVERLEVIADTYLSVSPPLAHCLPQWLELRRTIQPRILDRVITNRDFLDAQIGGSVITRLESEGGWYAILKLPSTRSDEDWALEFLAEEGVLTHPGHFYDFASDGHMIISLLPQAGEFEEGIGRLKRFVNRGL